MRWLFRLLPRSWTPREGVRFRAMHAGDLDHLFTEYREVGRKWLSQQDCGELYVAVAEIGGRPVGRRCLNFTWLADRGTVYCFAAEVLQQWQSRGIGSAMDRHSEVVARARGFHALQAAISKGNVRGLDWHKRLGYRPIEERVERWQGPDGEIESECWIVERRWADHTFISRSISRWRDRSAVGRITRRMQGRADRVPTGSGAPMTREADLRLLNEQYVKASLAGDVEWYRAHLADEFVCIESDGTVLDKDAFLRKTAQGSDLAEYRLDEVDVRFYGDVALVRATGSWTAKNGTPGLSRYVDVYTRARDEWKAVSAQITRPKA